MECFTETLYQKERIAITCNYKKKSKKHLLLVIFLKRLSLQFNFVLSI